MNEVRFAKNFRKNFLTREQKILLRFDKSNVIDAMSGKEGASDPEFSDIDKEIVVNVSSKDLAKR
jgi:hypothetical protein